MPQDAPASTTYLTQRVSDSFYAVLTRDDAPHRHATRRTSVNHIFKQRVSDSFYGVRRTRIKQLLLLKLAVLINSCVVFFQY
jgi:hypothetical protein